MNQTSPAINKQGIKIKIAEERIKTLKKLKIPVPGLFGAFSNNTG